VKDEDEDERECHAMHYLLFAPRRGESFGYAHTRHDREDEDRDMKMRRVCLLLFVSRR
jgi:hypothetical protein